MRGRSAAVLRGRAGAGSARARCRARRAVAPSRLRRRARRTPRRRRPWTSCSRRAGGGARPSSPGASRAATVRRPRPCRAAGRARGRTEGRRRARPRAPEDSRAGAARPASHSPAGARSRRPSCRRRGLRRPGSASRSSPASRGRPRRLRPETPVLAGRACPLESRSRAASVPARPRSGRPGRGAGGPSPPRGVRRHGAARRRARDSASPSRERVSPRDGQEQRALAGPVELGEEDGLEPAEREAPVLERDRD